MSAEENVPLVNNSNEFMSNLPNYDNYMPISHNVDLCTKTIPVGAHLKSQFRLKIVQNRFTEDFKTLLSPKPGMIIADNDSGYALSRDPADNSAVWVPTQKLPKHRFQFWIGQEPGIFSRLSLFLPHLVLPVSPRFPCLWQNIVTRCFRWQPMVMTGGHMTSVFVGKFLRGQSSGGSYTLNCSTMLSQDIPFLILNFLLKK